MTNGKIFREVRRKKKINRRQKVKVSAFELKKKVDLTITEQADLLENMLIR
jgi:hypothetical protein